MVIFRIFFNLFRIVSRGFFSIFWLPISILTKSPMLTLVLVGLFALYLFSSSDDQQTKQRRNMNPATMAQGPNGKPIQVATPVQRLENGDSAFSNDLYKQMTDPERAYYSQIFFKVMGTGTDGEVYNWSEVDIAGSIRVDHSFANKEGARCRMFSETLKVHAVQQQISGMACQNGATDWCKLPTNATPACNLGHQPGFLDGISSSFNKLF